MFKATPGLLEGRISHLSQALFFKSFTGRMGLLCAPRPVHELLGSSSPGRNSLHSQCFDGAGVAKRVYDKVRPPCVLRRGAMYELSASWLLPALVPPTAAPWQKLQQNERLVLDVQFESPKDYDITSAYAVVVEH